MKSKVRFRGKLRSYLCWPLWLTIPMTIADVGLYFYDVTAGFLLTVFIAVYFVLELGLYYNTRPRLANEIINFATQYATVQKRLLNEFEIPYALLDYTGKILWVNERFSELTGVGRNYHKSITTLFPILPVSFFRNTKMHRILRLKKGAHFRISLNRIYFDDIMEESKEIDVKDSDEFLTALYLFDETELQHCRQENLDQKQVSALVYIDNYDEALDSIEDVKRSLLIALVDRKVNQYFSKMDALVRKIEKDKYFVVFKYKYLQKLMDDRFSVLEDVKTVKVGNEMAVTLSIGVGIKGTSYNENYEQARAAIDLALGRGGDQVVVKNGEDIAYFGGKAKQVERNTRVKARVKAHALHEIIESRENVIIMGHSLTDVDSLGAGIGIFCAARVLGKRHRS